jgi:hypothetical protein
MEKFEKILVLNNEYEAELLEEVLLDKNIPHAIIALSDSVLGPITDLEYGWGYVEAPEKYSEQILEIYDQIIKK